MAAIVNAIDRALQATVPRYAEATDHVLLVNPPVAIFKVEGDGSVAGPGSFTFQANLINIEGAVTWSWTDGMEPVVNGNKITLDYANFSAVSGTITASIDVNGKTEVSIATITKLTDGSSGSTTYTWIKYADDIAGGGLSDDGTGKAYIGLAYNKRTPVESNNPADYMFSRVTGAAGQDGTSLLTWLKYSDYPDGSGLYDTPTSSTMYVGLAVNKASATESTNKADYTWSKFKGDQGVPGKDGNGLPGPRGTVNLSAAVNSVVWDDNAANAAIAAAGYGTHQVRDVVKLYNKSAGWVQTRFWDGGAWQPAADVVDGNQVVRGSLNSDSLATGAVTASKVTIGASDNLIPDPQFRDLAWWGLADQGVSVAQWADTGQQTGWLQGTSLYLDPSDNVERISDSRWFPIVGGASYKLTLQVNLTADFNGALSVYVLIDGTAWIQISNTWVGANWPDGLGIGFNGSSTKGLQTFNQTINLPYGSPNTGRALVRIHRKISAGKAEIGAPIMTRMTDNSLVVNGGITAEKLAVGQLDAITGRIGTLQTAGSGQRSQLSDSGLQIFDQSNYPVIQVGYY